MEDHAPEPALEPRMTADEIWATVPSTTPQEADFTQHRRCGHWRS